MPLNPSASCFKPSLLATKPSLLATQPSAKNYVSNGYVMNNNGYLANPTHAAQVAANNAGALTRSEAASMGLSLGGRR